MYIYFVSLSLSLSLILLLLLLPPPPPPPLLAPAWEAVGACFTGTKVQIAEEKRERERDTEKAVWSCFTSTKVQIAHTCSADSKDSA